MAEELKAGEKVYTISLREAFKKAERKRVPYSMKLIKKYLLEHTKTQEIKIGRHLNEHIWERSRTKPPRRVRVKVVAEGPTVKAELLGYDYEEFTIQAKKEKKGMKEKLLERMGPKAAKKQEEEQKVEGRAEKAEKAPKIEKHQVEKE